MEVPSSIRMRIQVPDKSRLVTLLSVLGVVFVFIIGILIGTYGIQSGAVDDSQTGKVHRDRIEDKEFIKSVLDKVEPDRVRSYLEELSKEPHIAASRRDRELRDWIVSQWKDVGIDTVSLVEYDILLAYPNSSNPNKIYLMNEAGEVQFTSRHKEDVLRKEDDHPEFIHAFNAYTPPGDVKGELVYVNYGRVEDIQQLQELGVSLKGRIAISKYGKIYRGNIIENCQDAGAI